MTIALRAGALALACLLFTAAAAIAAEPARTFLDDVWAELRPVLLTLIAGLLPVLGTWLTTEIVRRLKVARDSDLALSLGRTIDTTLKAIIATKVATGQGAQALAGVPGGVVADAIPIIRRDNPAGVAAHAPTDEQLRTKIIAKLPDAQGVVAEAAAKVEAAAK